MYHFHLASKPITVLTLAQAQEMWNAYRTNYGTTALGRRVTAAEIGNGLEIRNYKGELVARVSYNGRLWHPDGTEMEVG